MTELFCDSAYNYIRSYYNFYTPRAVFVDTYMREFEDIPEELVKEAIESYCSKPYNKQAPAITDVKNYLLRRKWALKGRYNDKLANRTLTKKMANQLLAAIEGLTKGLKGYGEDIEEEDRRLYESWYVKYGNQPKVDSYLDKMTADEVASEVMALGEFFDL